MRQMDALPAENHPKYMGTTKETLRCEECNNPWERFSRRGRKPKLCPSCISRKNEARVITPPSDSAQVEARMLKAREKKAERRVEQARIESEQRVQMAQSIRDQLPTLHRKWEIAWNIANATDTEEAWNKAENLMLSYVRAKKAITT